MPWKRIDSTVYVLKGGEWKVLKRYPSTPAGRKQAEAYRKALWAKAG